MDIRAMAASIQPELVAIRRHFHQHPELSMEEVNTANYIVEQLQQLGIDVERKVKTGVVGTLKGKKDGPVVALRADIDALPIKEETGLSFASVNDGIMHACGHDAHTTCLLGAAKILSQIQDEIPGTVKFVFQPGEEQAIGAKLLIEEGVLEGVDAIFGMHVDWTAPAGTVSVDPGPRMASADMFTIHVEGKGAHGSAPHQGVDAAVVAAAIMMNLQTIVSREIDPLESAVISIGKLVSGDRFNILPARAYMEGTCRCFNPAVRENIPDSISRVIENTAATFRATAKLHYQFGCPSTINDEALTALAQNSIKRLYGDEALTTKPPEMGSEDFAFYAEKIPATYAYLGIANSAVGACYPEHHARYTIDESALQVGAATYAQFAVDFLTEKS